MAQAHPPTWAVFTDGSCYAKDRIGGWAWVAFTDDREMENSGALDDTTISCMELMAPIEFLTECYTFQGPSWVLVFSDSEYVVKGITDRSRTRRKNREFWDALDAAVDAHEHVEFEHVYGHQGDCYNERADRLAGEARKKLQNELLSTSRP